MRPAAGSPSSTVGLVVQSAPAGSWALVAVSLVGCALTVAVPDLLTGPAVMTGSARGTALVVVLVGLPLLAVSTWTDARGSLRAASVRAGATAYLLYNAVMFVFATPFNRLFLLYVAMLGLALWTLVDQALHLWQRAARLDVVAPRWIAVYLGVIVGLNALLWLARVIPAMAGDEPTDVLDGTGLTTNPVFVQDLAFWLPAMAWLALGVWREHAPRVALAAAGAVFWVLEAIGVGVDQWWGHRADPASPVASATLVPVFLALAVIGLVPALLLLRSVDRAATSTTSTKPAHTRPSARVVLAVVAGLNGVAALAGAWGLASGVLDLGATVESRLPAQSTMLAALALAVAVGVPNTVLVVLAVRGDRRAGPGAVVAGGVLVGWILVELAFIRELSFFHPLYVGIGLLMVWLGARQ